jgi:3'-phosphoadenosine 5'-phosphosulfate sulfotransferase (PAPS reductase)/FAD synthetase
VYERIRRKIVKKLFFVAIFLGERDSEGKTRKKSRAKPTGEANFKIRGLNN